MYRDFENCVQLLLLTQSDVYIGTVAVWEISENQLILQLHSESQLTQVCKHIDKKPLNLGGRSRNIELV